MKWKFLVVLLTFGTWCNAQEWYGEISLGAAQYNGDLTQRSVSINRVRPSGGINLKYNTGDFVNFRMGISYAKLVGDDRDNPDPGLRSRNLNFKTNLYELNLCAEVNILDPFAYYAYPYAFGGIGVFRYNPYTLDDNGQKVSLQPLGTEGQGLNEFPSRKKYSLTQICFPVGGGFKVNVDSRYEVGFEFGYRLLLTDYLDDVSKTYVSQKALFEAHGQQAVDLAYRKDAPFTEEGENRGNAKVKDSYFMAGFKLAIRLGGGDGY